MALIKEIVVLEYLLDGHGLRGIRPSPTSPHLVAPHEPIVSGPRSTLPPALDQCLGEEHLL